MRSIRERRTDDPLWSHPGKAWDLKEGIQGLRSEAMFSGCEGKRCWFGLGHTLLLVVIYVAIGVSATAVPEGWDENHLAPSFFIIGAQKGGTTSLFQWLERHPLIALPKEKELCYFSSFRLSPRRKQIFGYTGIDSTDFLLYSRQFPARKSRVSNADEKEFQERLTSAFGAGNDTGFSLASSIVTYEACPAYSQDRYSAMRTKHVFDRMKAVFVVRNPIDRIVSAYSHGFHKNWYDGHVRRATDNKKDVSFYLHQLLPNTTVGYQSMYESYARLADAVLDEFGYEYILDKCKAFKLSEHTLFCRRSLATKVCRQQSYMNSEQCRNLRTLLESDMPVSLLRKDRTMSQEEFFLVASDYITAYQTWANAYGSENVFVVISEEMYDNPADTVNSVLDFVGLPQLQPLWLKSLQAVNVGKGYIPASESHHGERWPLDEFHRALLFHVFQQPNRELMNAIQRSQLPRSWTREAAM